MRVSPTLNKVISIPRSFLPFAGSYDEMYQAFLSLSVSSFFSASQTLEEGELEEGLHMGTRLKLAS